MQNERQRRKLEERVASLGLFEGSLEAFVDHVVPILQQRGLHRHEYPAGTLRGHLAER